MNKQLAPTAIASLVCGILSINLSLLVIPGFILSAIGRKKSDEGYDVLIAHPDEYTGEGLLKAGSITSKVGFFLSFGGILYWVFYIIYFYLLFSAL